MAFKFKELEGNLGRVINGIIATKKMVLLEHEDEDYEVWLEPDFLHIEKVGINIFCGITCVYLQEIQDFELSHDIYIFYDDAGQEVYSEHGSDLRVCIENYLSYIGSRIKKVDNLMCTYALDNGKFLREKVLKKEEC